MFKSVYHYRKRFVNWRNCHSCILCRSGGQTPVIGKIDGDYQFDSRKTILIWSLSVIDQSNSEGSLEFSVRGKSADFFPIQVDFVAETPFCDIKVTSENCRTRFNRKKISLQFRLTMSKLSTLANQSHFPMKRISLLINTNMFDQHSR